MGVVARADDEGALAGAHDLALEALASRGAEDDLTADRVAEVLRGADGPLEPGRRDVDGVLAQVVAQNVGDARAERVVDPLGVVDEDGEPLGVGELDLDYVREEGRGRNAVVRFMDTPIFYLPWMSFSLNNQKKSGFLPPTFGSTSKSGIDFATPWYWNIAPNRDATLL